MTPVIETYPLGFYDDNGIETLYAKQNDTERWVKFKLEDNQLGEYIIDNKWTILFREHFSDGSNLMPQILDKSAIVDNNTALQFQLTSDMLSVPGVANCEIAIVKSGTSISFDDEGKITNLNLQQLTTTTFNLYIDACVNDVGSIDQKDPDLLDLMTLIITIQGNEEYRVRNEKERVAREGSGTYEYNVDLTYPDENGILHTIPYKDSRRGLYERMMALTRGGSFVDDNGDVQTFVNQYIDLKGNVVTPDISELDNISMIALAAWMKSMAEKNYWAKLSESFAHGGTGLEDRPEEDTDNAEYYAHRTAEHQANAKNYMEQTQEILDALNGYLDANLPDCQVNLDDGHLYWEGGIFNFLVTYYDGHLRWEAIGNDGVISDEADTDLIALAAQLHSVQNTVNSLKQRFDDLSLDLSNLADKATLDQVKADAEYIKDFINNVMLAEDDA